eukprot:2952091-Amphidinium_carterae.1
MLQWAQLMHTMPRRVASGRVRFDMHSSGCYGSSQRRRDDSVAFMFRAYTTVKCQIFSSPPMPRPLE